MSQKISPKWTAFVFGNTYFHQTFTECVCNQYAHFIDIPDVTECYGNTIDSIEFFLGIFIHNLQAFMSEV